MRRNPKRVEPTKSDCYYSNGVSLSFARCVDEDNILWPQMLRLPGLDRPGLLGAGFDIGQVMVTPADTARPVPDPRDRPYAGLLFVGVSWQRLATDDYAALKLITGVVGPASPAEQTQKTVHRTFGVALPQGWDHQLRTEPILNAVYERRRRVGSWGDHDGWGGDTLLVGGAMLGNVLTQGYAQLQVRAGWRTPPDFGTSLIRGIGALPPARCRVVGHPRVRQCRRIRRGPQRYARRQLLPLRPQRQPPPARRRRRRGRRHPRSRLAVHDLVGGVGPRV